MHSYITGRSQSVVDEPQSASAYKDVTSGMPQGSSPGPVFFVALINSLPKYLKFCKNSYILFADDLEIYIQCPPNMLASAIKYMNEDIVQVSRWASDQGLSLNAAKTNAIIFGSTANLQYLSNKTLPPLMVGDQEIAIVNQVKSLGVILSSDLTWNAHISSLSKRVHGVLHKLRTRGWLLPQRLKSTLVQTLVLPRIDYACLVYNDIPAYLQLKVQRLANAGIRFVFNLRRDVSITPYRTQLGWPTLNLRRLYFLASLAYSVLAKCRPYSLNEKLKPIFRSVRRSSRLNLAHIEVPSSRTAAHKGSFYISAATLLASLPNEVLNIPTLSSFRARLRVILYGESSST